MFVSGDHAGKILEIGGELFEFDHIIGFYVVPTPNKLGKCLFLGFPPCQYFRMTFSIKHFTQFFKSSRSSNDLSSSFICLDDWFITILVHFSSEVCQKLSVIDHTFSIIRFQKIVDFVLTQKDLSTLETPSEIILI